MFILVAITLSILLDISVGVVIFYKISFNLDILFSKFYTNKVCI